MENLKFLGAISDGNLTKLGKKMALLPLEPNLSKVLLDGIEKGVGTEAAAAVAISTLGGRVFFRPDTQESRDESDTKRLPFCQQSGDQMTYLHTYFQWSRQERSDRNKWCVENFVNAKSMRMVQQIVEEICFTMKRGLSKILPENMSSLDKADEVLPKLFFDAFLRNVCVHLGHDRAGYWCERLPKQQLVIHYGSSLRYLASTPRCVVFEKTQKTSEHFLLQALPVREEWLTEAVESGKLPCHPAEKGLYQFYRVFPLTFANLGPKLSSKLQYKFPQRKKGAIPEFAHFDFPPIFEHSRERGTLVVYAQENYHTIIKASIELIIDEVKQKLRGEMRECGTVSDIKMVIGSGACIQHILMPGDFQTVVVRGLTDRRMAESAEHELKSYGKCTTSFGGNPKGIQLFLKFEDPTDAAKALTHQFLDFQESRIRIQSLQGEQESDSTGGRVV